ncbi:MAG: hypothetical protein JO112_07175 [Planctomycetes bacterium]|nr:hypothetical protein [Planctomycetota bacterium]
MNAFLVLATTAWLAGAQPVPVNAPVVEGQSCGCGGGAPAYVEGEMPMTGSYRSYSRSYSSSARPTFFARFKGMFRRDSESAESYGGMEYSSGYSGSYVESAPAKGTFVETSPTYAGKVITPVPQTVSTPMPMPTTAQPMGNQMPVGEPPVIMSGPGSAQ